MKPSRGFTLLELLVVVSIIAVILVVFAGAMSTIKSGPAIQQAASGITTLAARARQTAASQKLHTELVLDYKNDRCVALTRQRIFTFAFEADPAGQSNQASGGGDIIGEFAGNPRARVVSSRTLGLREGGCLELESARSSFNVPWDPAFTLEGDYEGVACSFDLYTLADTTGSVVSFGSVFTLRASHTHNGAIELELNGSGRILKSDTMAAGGRWCSVELVVSRYALRLYLDGRLSQLSVNDPAFTVQQAAGANFTAGGLPCRIDNLQLYSLIGSQSFEIGPRAQLIAPGVSPEREINGQAEDIYDIDRPRTGTGAGSSALSGDGLPESRPPAITHLHFDETGKLDPNLHPGAVEVYLVASGSGGLARMVVTIFPLGAARYEFLERFPWEPEPEAAPAPRPAPKPASEAAK